MIARVASAGATSDELARTPRRSAQPADATPVLWHFTCDHAAPTIRATGSLLPRAHPFLPNLRPVVWLTTMRRPDAQALGLTSDFIRCNRTLNRFRVTDSRDCLPWRLAVAQAPPWAISRDIVALLEDGRQAHTWWISPLPVAVVRA